MLIRCDTTKSLANELTVSIGNIYSAMPFFDVSYMKSDVPKLKCNASVKMSRSVNLKIDKVGQQIEAHEHNERNGYHSYTYLR